MLTWFAQNPWAVWIAVMVVFAYVVVTFLLTGVIDYFFGKEVAQLFFSVFGCLIVTVGWGLDLLFKGLSWPWKYRNRRLLRETFGLSNSDPWVVNRKLEDLAQDLDKAFKTQVKVRILPEDTTFVDADVRFAKKKFWSAHALAKKNGFPVHGSYKDYLYPGVPVS